MLDGMVDFASIEWKEETRSNALGALLKDNRHTKKKKKIGQRNS
jgi:hypothetical protein